jgi:hypothetical protein
MNEHDRPDTGTASNVIDFLARKARRQSAQSTFIRLAPELDGLEMLYSNSSHPGKYFSCASCVGRCAKTAMWWA